jgi:beta-aspartyl-peptidase (threonine type)
MRWREHRRGPGLPEDDAPGEDGGKNPEDGGDKMLLDTMPMGTIGAVALNVHGLASRFACILAGE